ncbi:MAG: AMP-binding protein, partial [bacterium]|nr:AMP-binding protein [bacterium]
LGLIGCWLFGLYYAAPVTILSPLDFLKRPERWLWAIHESRATLSAGPNFAYELCARRIPAWTLKGIDLSSWRVAVNAGEPVLPETVERFSKRFEPFGFRAESMTPCYGLAESTVALTMPPPGRLPVRDHLKREVFETQDRAQVAEPGDTTAHCFYSAGRPVKGQQVRVVDDRNREVPERTIGRLLFRGESTMSGYHRNPDATAAAFVEGGWLDTGDYGYLADGEFFFTGRGRDAITKGGRSMSPLDVEVAVGDLSGLVPGAAVAFGVADPESGAEQLVVAAETGATAQEDFRRLEAEIVRVVDTLLGMPPDKIQLTPPDSLPRTANGKIRRNEIRALYLKGKLRSRSRPPWLQIVLLKWENLGALAVLGLRRTQASVVRFSTNVLGGIVARTAGLWIRLTGRFGAARTASRWILALHGQRYSLQGAQLLDGDGPAVLVANRSGMLDPLVVLASLPREVLFAEVSALNGLPPSLRFLLKPLVLGHKQRDTLPSAGAVRQRVAEALEQGRTIFVFPDSSVGTPVLRSRFRLDTFQAGLEKEARLHPTAVRERSQTQASEERVRVRKVTMLIVREPVWAKAPANPFEVRNHVRESIGGYHA